MAEFYEETLLMKVEVIDGQNTFGGLKNWRKRLIQLEAIKVKEGLLRINFCNRIRYHKSRFSSIIINPFNNFEMKRGVTVAGPKWYILSAGWRNEEGAKCEISFAFDSEVQYDIHRNIFESFLSNLRQYQHELTNDGEYLKSEFREQLESKLVEYCANNLKDTPRTLKEKILSNAGTKSDQDIVYLYHVDDIHFISRAPPEMTTSPSGIESSRNGQSRRLSLKKCFRRLVSLVGSNRAC